MSRIIISVSNDLISDRRVDKVCSSLNKKGYDITLVGCIKKIDKPVNRAYKTKRFRMLFRKGFLFYFEYNLRLFFRLLFIRKDALLCNDTDALPANFLASKICRKPLIFDAHELFPEVPEVVNRRFVKGFWQKIEDIIFPHLKYSYTVCQSIADYYNKRYGIEMGVVRNIPSMALKEDDSSTPSIRKEGKKILLYQGAINVGRGVEWIIKAMIYLDNCLLYICGDGDLAEDMKQLAKSERVEDRVVFTGRIPADRLDDYTKQADLGFVLLANMGLSYYYSLPNRIFDYMKYGVPVLATKFPEIARIVEGYNTGQTTETENPEELAATIKDMLANWNDDETRKRIAICANHFNWENEEKVLFSTVAKALSSKT